MKVWAELIQLQESTDVDLYLSVKIVFVTWDLTP